MKVRAKEQGFYDNDLRDPGQEFEISKQEHLGSWMEPVGWKPKKGKGKSGTPAAGESKSDTDPDGSKGQGGDGDDGKGDDAPI